MGYFFLNGFKVDYTPGCSREQWAGNPAKLAAFSEFYYAPQVDHISSRQCGTFFFLGLGNEF